MTISNLEIDTRYRISLVLQGYEKFLKYVRIQNAESYVKIPLQKNVAAEPSKAANIAYLSVKVQPKVYIYIDGVLKSKTGILTKQRVKPGVHSLRFLNTKIDIDYNVTVETAKGQHIIKTYTLR